MQEEQKKRIRQAVREKYKMTDADQRNSWSAHLCELLSHHKAILDAQVILAFHPLTDEPDIMPLVERLVEKGKTIVMPAVIGEGIMEARRFTATDKMNKGALGTIHPDGECIDGECIDVAIVPGQAFTLDGKRMGRGKGYYDRYLSSHANIYKIGVCFPYQLTDFIPTADHDVSMHEVVGCGYA